MAIFPIGSQRVGIETDVPVLDEDGQPTYTEYNEPIVTHITAWVDGACFEIQTPSEQQNMTLTTSEIAWAMLPVADGVVPAVDDDDQPVPIQFFGEGGRHTISADVAIWHNGLRYEMRGDAVLEQDIRGRQDHVFCVCEREGG